MRLKVYDVYLKKIILWMKTIHCLNKIISHLVTMVKMAPLTPKSTSKLRSARHFRYSIVIPSIIPYNPKRNPNNHYNDRRFS